MFGEILQNVYETLIFYDGESRAIMCPNWLLRCRRYQRTVWFTRYIRPDVTHNGDVLTPTDVAYSFQRGLLQGGTSSHTITCGALPGRWRG